MDLREAGTDEVGLPFVTFFTWTTNFESSNSWCGCHWGPPQLSKC